MAQHVAGEDGAAPKGEHIVVQQPEGKAQNPEETRQETPLRPMIMRSTQ
jgi:hypothetical protein